MRRDKRKRNKVTLNHFNTFGSLKKERNGKKGKVGSEKIRYLACVRAKRKQFNYRPN